MQLGTPITQFTQADISTDLARYVHDGSDTISDSLYFTLSDGGSEGDASGTFLITVPAMAMFPMWSIGAVSNGTCTIGP